MEAHARYAMLFFNMMKEVKIAGSVFWSYNDWRTDRPSLVTRATDPFVVTMGLVDLNREKRTAFDVIRALFNDEKVQALPVGNYSSNTPIIYVVSGFLMLILFAFMYNANRRFRDSVNRSLFRTYNFFADVRDQRIISNSHSIILAIVIAITWATVSSSIITHYRSNLLFDNLMSQFLPDFVKEWLIRLVWSPANFILVFSGIILVKLLLIALIVKLFSMLVKTRVMFYHAFSVSIWSSLPYIILIPIGMILFRLMETEFYILPIFIILGVITLWVFIRLLKGISIIYDVYPGRVYAFGILILILVGIIVYGYLDYTQSTSLYLKYFLEATK
jgi:beta-galactosidase